MILAGLLLLHFLTRWQLASSSFLAPPDYDESITGLMALHFLRGQGEVFFWGQPYMGTLEPLLVSLVMWFSEPSALAMRLVLMAVSSLTLLAVYAVGREIGGRATGLLAGLFWALPPVFLSFDGLYATGGHLESVAAGAFFLYGACRLAFRPPRREVLFAFAVSVAAGLGFWCSLLVAPLLAACVAALLIARPRLLLTWTPWVMLAGFLAGSAPFWWWNLSHDFMTFRAVEQGSGHILGNLWLLAQGVWLHTFTGAWWNGNSVEGLIPWPARAAVALLVYLPALGLVLALPAVWCLRLVRRGPPLGGPLDLLAAAAWGVMLAHAASSYGHTGVTRYAETLFVPLAGLVAWWLMRVWTWRKAAGAALLVVLFGFNLTTHLFFERSAPLHPQRSTAKLVAKLKGLGITHALASGRVAYPLTFLSGEGIICADFFGWRNYNYLDEVKRAPRIALVAHEEMASPTPSLMASALAMIGAQARRGKLGPHEFWYDFQPPPAQRPIPRKGWRITSSRGEKGLEESLTDRNLASSWNISGQPGTWLELKNESPAQVSGLTLLADPASSLAPLDAVDLRVETSEDGLTWRTAAEGPCLAGLGWSQAHPLVRETPALEVRFPPRPASRVRLVFNPSPAGPPDWALAEIYLRAPDPTGEFKPTEEASQALEQAERLLRPYHDEPLGPHPRFPGVPIDYRCGKVDWLRVLDALGQAAAASPDWDEPQRRLLEAVRLAHQEQGFAWPDPRALELDRGKASGLTPEPEPGGGLLRITGEGRLKLGPGLWGREVRGEPGRPWEGPLLPEGETAPPDKLVKALGRDGQVLLRLPRLPRPTLAAGAETWSPAPLVHVFGAGQMSAEGLAPIPNPDAARGVVLRLDEGQAGRKVKVWFPYYLERGRYVVEFQVRAPRQEQPLATFGLLRHFQNRVHDQPVSQAWRGEGEGRSMVAVAVPWDNDLEPVKLEAQITYHGPGTLEVEAITLRPGAAGQAGSRQDAGPDGRAVPQGG